MAEVFLSMWVIYDHPRDYPDSFVVRRWSLLDDHQTQPEDEVFVGATLAEVRARIPPGLILLARFEEDDPRIVEVWL